MTFTPTAGTSPSSPGRAAGALRMTPGRWVALALGVPVALTLIGWTGFTLVTTIARASYPFSYPVEVHGGQVAVNVNSGNVTLRQAPGAAARLTGTVQYGLIRPGLVESTTATGTSVSVNCDGIASDCGMDATLVVPPQTGVSLASSGGDITVSGFTAPLRLSTQGGNMNVSNLAGDLRLDTGGGDLTGSYLTGTVQVSTGGGNVDASNLGNVSAMLQFDTGGGDVTGSGFSGQVRLVTGGGNIDLNYLASPEVNADSGGGDITLTFTQVPVSVHITAAGGNVTLILPPGDTKYDILTPGLDGGNVSYPSTLASPTSPNTISVNSGGGDITITQAS